MWFHRYEFPTSLSPDELWSVLADVSGWPKIDANIEWLRIDTEPKAGATFKLKPIGGPVLNFTIGCFDQPSRYSDISLMPLARMETLHHLVPQGTGTLIRIEIKVVGLLSGLWGYLVGARHAAGLPAQTEKFVGEALVRRSNA
jgi:hypothetical protein